MFPRVPACAPGRLPAAPCGRAGVTVLAGRPAAEPPERACPEDDLPFTEARPLLLLERLTVPLERDEPDEERLTLDEERPVLEDEREAVPVEERLF